jgi:hypothetical protein
MPNRNGKDVNILYRELFFRSHFYFSDAPSVAIIFVAYDTYLLGHFQFIYMSKKETRHCLWQRCATWATKADIFSLLDFAFYCCCCIIPVDTRVGAPEEENWKKRGTTLAKAKINKSVLQSLIKLNFGLID